VVVDADAFHLLLDRSTFVKSFVGEDFLTLCKAGPFCY
jgi:hypothetical protein